MTQTFSLDKNYKSWVVELKKKIQSAQIKAAMMVNRQLLELYWDLGREICEKQKKAEWGDGVIEQLAKDLTAAFPGMKGFSRRNLLYIRKWYSFYNGSEIVQKVAALIPWWHNVVIISKCSSVKEALFYTQKATENNWSRAILELQIESGLYERSGKIINNFDRTLSEPQADFARETLKNPYNFDFLTLGKEAKGVGPGVCIYGEAVSSGSGWGTILFRYIILPHPFALLCCDRVEDNRFFTCIYRAIEFLFECFERSIEK
jgi:predicted nuclease of restriction endonuclease-like (RecB) superfamily